MEQLALVLLNIAGTGLVAVVAWNLKTFRQETREAIHELRDKIHPVATDVAVLKSQHADRRDLLETIREALHSRV
jgi:hypothetical protein